ncbi:hypothetical protein [Streptomyces sp. NPDC005953]|uniref:hypothetical protein n=1 Tax=Streptomyces sp. NPDC005953 TaxID=3156719 RepID=UPI0033E9E155
MAEVSADSGVQGETPRSGWIAAVAVLTVSQVVKVLAGFSSSPVWLTAAWGLFTVAAVVMAGAWVSLLRGGARDGGNWTVCGLVHALFVWQLVTLAIRS